MNQDQRRKELADFLKKRRLRITPEEAGLSPNESARRRTQGLRREEVAVLSGISLPWYTSLEQGRDIRVSEQVLESLVRTLRLSRDERIHLFTLANQPLPIEPEPSPRQPVVAPAMQAIINQLGHYPAYISDRKYNVLAWNRTAAAVFGRFDNTDNYGSNMLWRMFTAAEYREWFVEWEHLAHQMMAQFRAYSAREIEDPWYAEFVRRLSEASPEFKAWWADHEVRCPQDVRKEMLHPKVGKLSLTSHLFHMADADGLVLNIYTPNATESSVGKLLHLEAKSADSRHAL